MQTVLIAAHLIIVLALIGVILLQRSEGGLGLGGGGSGGVSGFMTGRGQANALTRATAVLAGLFFVTSMTLAVLAHRSAAPRSILDEAAPAPGATQQAPVNADNLLDTLRRQGGPAAPEVAPAPQAPEPAATAPAESAPAPVPDAPQSR